MNPLPSPLAMETVGQLAKFVVVKQVPNYEKCLGVLRGQETRLG